MDEWKAKLPGRFKRMRRNNPTRRALAWFVENLPEILMIVGAVVVGWSQADTLPRI